MYYLQFAFWKKKIKRNQTLELLYECMSNWGQFLERICAFFLCICLGKKIFLPKFLPIYLGEFLENKSAHVEQNFHVSQLTWAKNLCSLLAGISTQNLPKSTPTNQNSLVRTQEGWWPFLCSVVCSLMKLKKMRAMASEDVSTACQEWFLTAAILWRTNHVGKWRSTTAFSLKL